MVSQGLDLLRNEPRIAAYAAAYVDLVKDLSAKVERTAGADQQNLIVSLTGSAGGGHGEARH